MLTRYDAFYYGFSPAILPYVAWRWMRRGKYHQSAPGMLGGSLPSNGAARFAQGSVWIHAVSVGEVAAARAVEPGLRGLFPGLPFVVSTVTETGQEEARKKIPGAEAHTFFPADLSWNVAKFLDAFRPKFVILMETEIWPNFLTLARARGASIFLVNGKLSDRSFPRYRAVRGLLAPVMESISGYCVQTQEDARRFGELGVAANKIQVTGNCKLDLNIPPLTSDERSHLRAELGITEGRPVIVAGSTHPGEEGLILSAFEKVRTEIPNACLVIAPRHPERFGEATEIARRSGLEVARASESRSSIPEPNRPQVVILDKMGVLARTYGVGEVAIVAGSFGPVGGHNLLEAAAHKIPVLYGPNMKSQRELANLFRVAGAGTQVQANELGPALINLLKNDSLRRAEGEKAFGVLTANQGSAARSIEAIKAFIAWK